MGMNTVIYFESTYLKEQYISQWKQKARMFHYELQEVERLTSAIASQYFQFAVFAFDSFTQEKQAMVASLLNWKQDMPFFIIANSYENQDSVENLEFQFENKIYYFKPEDIKDLPGIILRILKQKMYYRRNSVRSKVSQTAELHIDNMVLRVNIKDLSKFGAKIELRKDPKHITQKQATLVHFRRDGSQVKVPLEICWANQAGDGRLHLGTRFQKFH